MISNSFLYLKSMMIHACIKFTLVLYNRVSLKLFFLFFFNSVARLMLWSIFTVMNIPMETLKAQIS